VYKSFSYPLTPENAKRILQHALIFIIPSEPPPGTVPTAEGDIPPSMIKYSRGCLRKLQAFNVILDQSDAISILQDVMKTGTPVGRLYALSALQVLNHSEFLRQGAELANSDAEVITDDGGCVVGRAQEGDVVREIARNHYGDMFRKSRQRADDYFGKHGANTG